MRTLIPPDYYRSPAIFRREREVFSRHCWQFAGLRRELANDNDFITADGFGKPVVIQNFKGSLRAFQNVCLHRHALLRSQRQGNGALQCPYHGWTYDQEGAAVGIPHRAAFPEFRDGGCREELRLPSFQVASRGELVFFADPGVEISLAEYLGDVGELLDVFSEGIGPSVNRTEWVIAANWKVVIENTLESYHVDKVHPNSFRNLFVPKGEKFQLHPPHSASTFELNESTLRAWKKLESQLPARPSAFDGYVHVHLFPFTTLASTFGASFSLQRIRPIAFDKTIFESEVYFTKLAEASKRQEILANAYGKSIVDFNRSVFDEDKEVCELVQKGLSVATHSGWLSEMEGRVHCFQDGYRRRVAADL